MENKITKDKLELITAAISLIRKTKWNLLKDHGATTRDELNTEEQRQQYDLFHGQEAHLKNVIDQVNINLDEAISDIENKWGYILKKPLSSSSIDEDEEIILDGESVDLFELYDELPEEVKQILDKYDLSEANYEQCKLLVADLNTVGYTCDYDLDGAPIRLQKIKS